ncbi:hypothetical protein [Paractinoplanes ferrugineus]|uniref:hypothetical protein n=1 Tax=Paractinoplanes ferrugineus TaxID=113564 RepID=UPI0031DABFED
MKRRRPVRKQFATVDRRASPPAGRPAAAQAALTRSVIASYDGSPAQTFSSRSFSTRSSRVEACVGSGSWDNGTVRG